MPRSYDPYKFAENLRKKVFVGDKILLVNWFKVAKRDKSKEKYIKNHEEPNSIENCYRYKYYIQPYERNPDDIFLINEETYDMWTKAISEYLHLKSISRDNNEKINYASLEDMVSTNKDIQKLRNNILESLTNKGLTDFLDRNILKPPFDVPYQRAAKIFGGRWYDDKNNMIFGILAAGCNFQCPVCFVPHFCIKASEKYATYHPIEKIVEQVVKEDANILRMTGGIFGLEPKALFKIIGALKEKGREFIIHYELNLAEPAVKGFEDELSSLGKDESVEFIPCFRAIDKNDFQLLTGGADKGFFSKTFDEFSSFWGRNITLPYVWSLIPGNKKERKAKFESSFIPELEKRYTSKEVKRILQGLWMIDIGLFSSVPNNLRHAAKRGYVIQGYDPEKERTYDTSLSLEVLDDVLREHTGKGYLRRRIKEGNY